VNEIEQIEAIYQAYPRHIGKRAAIKAIEKAIARIVKGNGTQDHVSPVHARRFLWMMATDYASSPAGQAPCDIPCDYRPHPSTWFNQDRFLDDPAEWLKPNGGSNGNRNSTPAAAISDETTARLEAQAAQLRRDREVAGRHAGA
jgi:hypothetical protein